MVRRHQRPCRSTQAGLPDCSGHSALPENVRDKYDRALKVKKIDAGFYAVGVRRLLEAVCNHLGVRKGDLFDRLKVLASNGAIPPTLALQAQELRGLGNLGAHDKDIDVEDADVPVIEDFAEAVRLVLLVTDLRGAKALFQKRTLLLCARAQLPSRALFTQDHWLNEHISQRELQVLGRPDTSRLQELQAADHPLQEFTLVDRASTIRSRRRDLV